LAVLHFFDASGAGKSHRRIPVEMDLASWQIQAGLRIAHRFLNKEV
jgi:hypothetical protein